MTANVGEAQMKKPELRANSTAQKTRRDGIGTRRPETLDSSILGIQIGTRDVRVMRIGTETIIPEELVTMRVPDTESRRGFMMERGIGVLNF
jgi:hypothetical protein